MTTGLVGQNQIAPFTSPIPGGSLDATVVLGNDNSTVTSYDAHDNDSTIHFQSSTLANRPPASTAGQKWLTTDAAARYLYYDSGSAWVEVNYFRDSGGIITGAVTISDTTESTSTTTGALIVSGGVGIAKNVFIGGTLNVTGVATFTAQPIVSTLTASLAVFSDSVKGLVSNALTGTGNVVMSASPTLTCTIGAASMTLSGTLGVTGVATFTAQPIVSSLTASKPVFTDASKGLVSTGTLGTDQGGTNLTTYTTGDILYASATNVLSKLAIGTTGQHLIVTAGLPAWGTDTALGTVTSVSWTGGLVSVATATTTPAFTVAGTSGGIPYFSSASTWASSAALTQYGIVYGGGAGATPVATAAGTTGQVLTAVTSGAPVWSATYAGTVTSVGFTGGLISVATATTTPALTVAGTSGGVVYFSSASTWASSAALTASALVLGGGAGAAPATTTTGTGVVTALGVNVGTAGAFVVNGGALGTPSSGAVAASLITAGTFGTGSYTFPGALAITGALTGVTTGTFSTSAKVVSGAIDTTMESDGIYAHGTSLYLSAPSTYATYLYSGGVLALTLASNQAATFASSLAISGAFTGATTGAFTGLTVQPTTGTAYSLFTAVNTGGTLYIGLDNSAGNYLGTGGAYGTGIYRPAATTFAISRTTSVDLFISATGAATFSGDVTIAKATAATFNLNSTTTTSLSQISAHADTAYLLVEAFGSTFGGTTWGNVTGNNQAVIEAQVASSLCISTYSSTVPIILAPGRTAALTLAATGAATFSSTVQIGTVSTLAQNGNSIYASRNFEFNLTYSPAITNNKDIGFAYVDNTHLRVYMKGSDGVTRSVDLTVA